MSNETSSLTKILDYFSEGFPARYKQDLETRLKRLNTNSNNKRLFDQVLLPSSTPSSSSSSSLQDGRIRNCISVEGLKLYKDVFSNQEQEKIVKYVYSLQQRGKSGNLRAATYTVNRIHGKERVKLQFGYCYNNMDKSMSSPDIIGEVDPIPYDFKILTKKMAERLSPPPTCIPNNCVVKIDKEGDCISLRDDDHCFVRPFHTVLFLNNSKFKVRARGEDSGSDSITIPVGSVLMVRGNATDIAKHCDPVAQGERITITFRKVDDSKRPFKVSPNANFQGIQPHGNTQENDQPSNIASGKPPPNFQKT